MCLHYTQKLNPRFFIVVWFHSPLHYKALCVCFMWVKYAITVILCILFQAGMWCVCVGCVADSGMWWGHAGAVVWEVGLSPAAGDGCHAAQPGRWWVFISCVVTRNLLFLYRCPPLRECFIIFHCSFCIGISHKTVSLQAFILSYASVLSASYQSNINSQEACFS